MSKMKGSHEKAVTKAETKKTLEPQSEQINEGTPLTFKEFYPVNPPFGYVGIQVDEKTGKLRYLTVEPTMADEEKQALAKLKTILMEEADVPLSVLKDAVLAEDYLTNQIKRAIRVFQLKVSDDARDKFIYYMQKGPSWLWYS